MLFARLVVEQDSLLQSVLHDLVRDFRAGFRARVLPGKRSGDFEHVVGASGIAAGIAGNFLENVGRSTQLHLSQAALFIGESVLDQEHNLLFGKRL